MLYLIGLGLGDVEDITVKGLKAVKSCAAVYLESYTSILPHGPSKEQLEAFYGREVILADREFVEQGCDTMLDAAVDSDVALLVVGDPFGATTHSDLMLRAKQRSIDVQMVIVFIAADTNSLPKFCCRFEIQVIHNASIMNACGCAGLQLYNFGQTVSICFWTDGWRPQSYFDRIQQNASLGLHTLCLLDIKVKEQTIENLMKGNQKFELPRYMTVAEAAAQLLEIIDSRPNLDDKEGAAADVSADTPCVGLARLGWPDQRLVYGSLSELARADPARLGPPLHSLIICGRMHDMEREFLEFYRL